MCVFFNYGFLRVVGLPGHMVVLFLVFFFFKEISKLFSIGLLGHMVVLPLVCLFVCLFKKSPNYSPQWLYQLIVPRQCKRAPSSPHPLQHLFFEEFLRMAILSGVRWYFTVALICISLISGVEHFFNVFVGHPYGLLWRNVYLGLPRKMILMNLCAGQE